MTIKEAEFIDTVLAEFKKANHEEIAGHLTNLFTIVDCKHLDPEVSIATFREEGLK